MCRVARGRPAICRRSHDAITCLRSSRADSERSGSAVLGRLRVRQRFAGSCGAGQEEGKSGQEMVRFSRLFPDRSLPLRREGDGPLLAGPGAGCVLPCSALRVPDTRLTVSHLSPAHGAWSKPVLRVASRVHHGRPPTQFLRASICHLPTSSMPRSIGAGSGLRSRDRQGIRPSDRCICGGMNHVRVGRRCSILRPGTGGRRADGDDWASDGCAGGVFSHEVAKAPSGTVPWCLRGALKARGRAWWAAGQRRYRRGAGRRPPSRSRREALPRGRRGYRRRDCRRGAGPG